MSLATYECVPKSIVVVGEALIDFLPCQAELGEGKRSAAYRPVCGGAPFNVSLTIGRLGGGAAFLGCCSEDMFGKQICAKLASNGVSLDYVKHVPNPTLLAFVSFAEDEPEYAFFTQNVADLQLTPEELPLFENTPAQVVHLSLGAFILQDSVAAAWKALLIREKERGLFLSFDPNIRPKMISDVATYRALLENWLPLFSLVKVSLEDLRFLYGADVDTEEVANKWLEGPNLVIVTAGSQGSTAYRKGFDPFKVPVDPIEVVDSVGAGDSYMGALLVHLQKQGALAPGLLDSIPNNELLSTMTFAAKVAAVNCSRAGCDPPSIAEIS